MTLKTNDLATKEQSTAASIDLFLQERRYLLNVSDKTLDIYKYSFQAFAGPMEFIDQVKARIVALREKGLTAVTVNTYLRHVKAFYLWQGKE